MEKVITTEKSNLGGGNVGGPMAFECKHPYGSQKWINAYLTVKSGNPTKAEVTAFNKIQTQFEEAAVLIFKTIPGNADRAVSYLREALIQVKAGLLSGTHLNA